MLKRWHHHCIFLKCSYFVHTKLSFLRSLSHVHTGRNNWSDQWCMAVSNGKYGDKKSIYNGKKKTKQGESTLVNTIDNLFCSFIINDDANIVLHHIAVKMETLRCSNCFQNEKTCTHISLLKNEVATFTFCINVWYHYFS